MVTRTEIIAREGWKRLGICGFLLLFFMAVEWNFFSFLTFVALVYLVMAFRNPERIPSESGENVLLAPIDAVVKSIHKREDSCVVTLYSCPYFVGMIRMPIEGTITRISGREGLRLSGVPKSLKKELNAQGELAIKSKHGEVILRLFPQLFLDNLHLYPKGDSHLTQGVRIGFMYNGYVELLLPLNVRLNVCEGDRIVGGESLLGNL